MEERLLLETEASVSQGSASPGGAMLQASLPPTPELAHGLAAGLEQPEDEDGPLPARPSATAAVPIARQRPPRDQGEAT